VAGYAPVPGTPWGLVTEESWATLIRQGRGYQWFLLLLLALGVVVPAVVVTMGVRRLIRPIEQLIDAAQEVAAGNFGHKISARTGDEIEELAVQFNRMSAELQESYNTLEQRVADRTRELAILNAIGATVNASLDLSDTLDRALSETLGLLNLEVGEIRLLDEESEELVIRIQRGLSPEFVQDADYKKVADTLPEAAVRSGEPVIEPDIFKVTNYPLARREGLRALGIFPLRAKERFLGTLCLATRRGPRSFTRPERELLRAISDQISVAIENAQLYGRAQQLAVLEERQRLARDLHDSVTQSLYGLTMYAEAATRLLAAGNLDMATDYLRELRGTAQEALREMRLLIFELRPSILEAEGLTAALQSRLESVEKRSGLETSLTVEGEGGQLSADVEEELYRIAQEALNNALKHAQANRISVGLYRRSDYISLEISDNGQGFDPTRAHERGGFGLRSMRERVSQLGGQLTIDSQPGVGTRVRVDVALPDGAHNGAKQD
jgi:nitrate/nitrite-specific signal transduction histidine kinase